MERGNVLQRLFEDRRQNLFDSVARLRFVVRRVDPSGFSEDQFAVVVGALGTVIDNLQKRLADMDWRDITTCIFLADSVRELRDAKHWISQGYSPDPDGRPAADVRRRLADERGAATLSNLFA
jgi:hypothetical protein